jgi:hypothetical protein
MNASHSKESLKQCSILGELRQKGMQRLASLSGLLTVFLGLAHVAHAQWQTQSITLKPGWNAVYLHVDASHYGVADVTPAPIDEIWLWNRIRSGDRFMSDPASPSPSQDWASWNRIPLASDTLGTLIGNAAYLVRNSSGSDYEWTVKGKPLPPTVPSYGWTSRGVNLIGFSTPENNPPTFSEFLSPVQRLASGGEFYRYDDGDQDVKPSRFDAFFNTVQVHRGQAYWVRHEGEFNRYFGAFEVVLQSPSGIDFGSSRSQSSLRIRNATSAELTVTLTLEPSEAAPAGETAITGEVPLLLRGALNPSDLTYGSENFASARQVTLKPRGERGSEIEVILGVNRSVLTGNPSDLYAGILRLTDALGYSQVDLPVTAHPSSSSGLWVGSAVVNQVRHALKTYEKDEEGNVVLDSNGRYVVTSTKTDLGSVARPFNLRLIVHKGNTAMNLLQRVYHGLNTAQAEVVAIKESFLDATQLASARRISSSHFPFSEGNAGWPLGGSFAQGGSVTATVVLGHDAYGSNPFLHGFHPDHDNLNATFDTAEAQGTESYTVQRAITLSFSDPGTDFASLVSGGNQMIGEYGETITFKGLAEESFEIDTAGGFALRRISHIDTLTTQ